MPDNLTRQLRSDEGVRKTVYADSLGFQTIGVGRLIDQRRPGAGLRDDEINLMLANDVADRRARLVAALPWFGKLDDARQGALLNMAFQLGAEGLLGFVGTLKLVQAGDYVGAAAAMLESRWAHQTPNRAARLAQQMRTGVWQFADGA